MDFISVGLIAAGGLLALICGKKARPATLSGITFLIAGVVLSGVELVTELQAWTGKIALNWFQFPVLVLALAAALMWAVYSILIKPYTESCDNFLVTRRVFLWAFLTSIPLCLFTDGLPTLTPLFTQPNVLISWLFLGVMGNAVCFAIWNIAFKALGVVVTNNYLYASPFVTVFVGWLLLREPISIMSIIGAVLITVGVIFAQKE